VWAAVVEGRWNLARHNVAGAGGENKTFLKGQGKSGVPPGRMNLFGAKPDTGVSG
jgi:hypothetical protein